MGHARILAPRSETKSIERLQPNCTQYAIMRARLLFIAHLATIEMYGTQSVEYMNETLTQRLKSWFLGKIEFSQ